MTPCSIWPGSISSEGYGRYWRDGRQVYAHRAAFEAAFGPIPDGLVIDHLCRNRACVNPEHMEAVSTRETTLRADSPAARAARSDVCAHGHPYDDANTLVRSSRTRTGWVRTWRQCRTCHREHMRRNRMLTA